MRRGDVGWPAVSRSVLRRPALEPARAQADDLRAPLFAPDDPPGVRRRRIARGISLALVAFALLTVTAPLLLAVAALVDLALWATRRKPPMGVRVVAIVWWVLFVELRGLAAVTLVWLRSGGPAARDTPARRRRVYAAQVGWGAGHFTGILRLCGVRVEVENPEVVGAGPMIVLARHASIVDFGLPAHVVSRAHGIDLRYALKRELLALPSLDIGARWVPTCFVRRSSQDPQREIAAVGRLAVALDGPRDGVLIYPEGTLFSAARLAKLKAKDELGDPELRAFVDGLEHVLPLRTGGVLALLDEAPGAAVVICGHVGLDGVLGLREIWAGDRLRDTVRVRFWRFEPGEIPADRSDRRTWLYERWQELDRWIGEQLREVA